MFSQLLIGYPSLASATAHGIGSPVIARSPILLTPFTGDWNIEAGPSRRTRGCDVQEAD
jgi:hypothetical protein